MTKAPDKTLHQPELIYGLIYGLIYALLATLLWGAQPLAIGFVIQKIPPTTLSFYKVFSAAVALSLFLIWKKQFPDYRSQGRRPLVFLIFCSAALAASYVLYAFSYLYISAANAQFYIQLSRIMLALAGIFIFHETFNKIHWLGLTLVFFGFFWFFKDQSGRSIDSRSYGIGALLVILSSVAWTKYAIFQKFLFKSFSPLQILVFVYLISTLILWPFCDFHTLVNITGSDWIALGFICLSNLLACAFFSLALSLWDASRVSTVSCLTPVVTLGLAFLFSEWLLKPENLGLFGIAGGLLIVTGSILVSLPAKS